ncbi:MAG: 30S ribosomal protein S8 [Deltaproteobacteria bacterium]|nr:30S ribosomal protein S8 [Deltaproteobacteria bacterium]
MALTDPIGDMLTRLRNAAQARHATVHIPASGLKKAILEQIREAGFVEDVDFVEDGRQGMLTVRLKYDKQGECVIDGLERLSKPGRRLYTSVDDIPKARSGYGTVIVSTSRGVLSDRKARELGVGGEVLCSIW